MGEILASLFESVLFSIFLTLFLEPKRGRKELFIGVVLTSGLLFLNIFISDKFGFYNIYVLFIDLAITLIFWKVFLRGSLINFLLGFVLYYLGLYLSTYIPSVIFALVKPGTLLALQTTDTAYRVGFLISSKILLPLYVAVLMPFRNKFGHYQQGAAMLCYSILPIIVLALFVSLTGSLAESYRKEPAIGIKMISVMVRMHFIVIVVIYLSVYAVRKTGEECEIERLNYMLHLQRESLEKFIGHEQELYRSRHELEHKLFTVQYLFEKDQKEKGFCILKQMICELYGDAKDICVSQNIVETVITNIERKYVAEGICIEKEILFPDETLMELVDLCVLLGDLLDNAMEAAVKSVEKRVKISIREEYNCLYLKISNTFSAQNSDVKAFISKKEKGRHGFGIWNIREIVRRYGGELITYDENQWFYTDVIIYGRK